MEDQLEEIAVTFEVFDLFDISVLEVIASALVSILPQRVVYEEDLLLAEDHEFLVALKLNQGDEIWCLTNKLVQGFDHRF